jgi:hypothetical protein
MRKSLIAGLSVLAVAGLSACSEKTQDKVENAGAAVGSDIDNNLDAAGAKIDNGLDHAGAAIDRGADKVDAAADNAAADAKREGREAKQNVGSAIENAGRDIKD